MAEVYVARQAGLQGFEKIVVIKRVRAELEGDAEATGFFLDEARLVATLEHPNIAQVYEIGFVNGSYFFVMEYVHGADLRQLLEASARRKQPLALANAIYIASHVCAALHYAHEKRDLEGRPLEVIHRDVSPSNVLLSHEGAIKLCDFGIAKAQNRSTETQRGGMLKGKYSYMSPEQCRTQPLDRRSDIFAMGIVLYEMSTLTRLFKASNDFDILRAIVEDPVPPPSSRMPDYPPELERIVLRALEKDPDKRYQTAQDMQLDLEAFAREHKLQQSSVQIAKLIGQMFEKRLEAWAKAQKKGQDFEEYLLDAATRPSGQMPVFMPIGSDDGGVGTEDPTPGSGNRRGLATPIPGARGSQLEMQALAKLVAREQTVARRRPSALWLIGAILAGIAGAGAAVAGGMLEKSAASDARSALEGDVERVVGTFEQASRAAHMKADGIASTPILRAAIDADSATMRDVLANEYVLSLAKGESVEIFQLRKDASVSLARLPAGAPPIKPLKGGDTRIDVSHDSAVVVASAPIASPKSAVAGTAVIATPIDLASARRTLAAHATRATIVGLGEPLEVLPVAHGDPVDGAALEFPLAITSDGSAKLVAVPIASSSSLSWLPTVRYIAFGLGGLLLALYLGGWIRAMRRPEPAAG